MTISPEPDGRVSLRVLIGSDEGPAADRDLLELIISSEHLSRALGGHVAESTAFPCHVGFCRQAEHTAA